MKVFRNLKDKVVVITGASSGIGEAAAYAFAEQGAHIVLAARRIERLEEIKPRIEQSGVKAYIVPTDVTDPWKCKVLIDATIEHFGQVDVLINNAGAGITGEFIDTPIGDARALFDLNVIGAMTVMQEALKTMQRQGWGVIINVASTAGILPSPYMSCYSATKAALNMVSQCAAIEYFDTRISIVSLCPHVTKTEFQTATSTYGRFKKMIFPGKPATAEWVAKKLVQAALNPKPMISLGPITLPAMLSKIICPPLYYKIIRNYRDKMRDANPPVD